MERCREETTRQERPGRAAGAQRPVRREFTIAASLDRLWLADFTDHFTAEEKLYLCAVKDAYSGRIVGYSIDARMSSDVAVRAVDNDLARRGRAAGCVFHTDPWSQFRSRKFQNTLRRHGLVGSMGRVGAVGDNAAMESFFALLQNNVLNRRRRATRQELRTAIVTWIEHTYDRRRRQARLGGLTPIEYETIISPPRHDTPTVTYRCSRPHGGQNHDQ